MAVLVRLELAWRR